MLDVRSRNTWNYRKMDIKPSVQVKKVLFGEPDHEELKRDLDRDMQAIREQDKQRWDYDFQKECPLPSSRWEPTADTTQLTEGEDAMVIPSSPVKRLLPSHSLIMSPSNQRSLDEFFPKRKRCSPSTNASKGVKRLLRAMDDRPAGRVLKSAFRPIVKPTDGL